MIERSGHLAASCAPYAVRAVRKVANGNRIDASARCAASISRRVKKAVRYSLSGNRFAA